MGAALDVPAGQSFSVLKDRMNTHGIRIGNEEMLARFEKAGQTFFELYARYVDSQKLNQEDCEELFEYVQKLFSTISNACRPDRTVQTKFMRDLTEVLEILTPFLELLVMILKKYRGRTSTILLTEFSIAVKCFKGAVNVTASREPPYCHLRVTPIISLLSAILDERAENISILAPDNSGKTHTLPLLLAIKMCEELLERPFLVLCESNPVMVTSVVEFLEEMFDESKDIIVVSTADQALAQMSADEHISQPVICVLSTCEALSMLHKCDDKVKLLSKTRFVFDDAHARSIETDVLLTIVTTAATKSHLQLHVTVPAHITLVSATPDPFVTGFLRNTKTLSCAAKRPFETQVKNVRAKDTTELRNLILAEAKQILLQWGVETPETPVGSMVVFMPGEAIGYRFAAGIRKALEYSRTRRPLVPLFIDVTPNDTAIGFFARVIQEMDLKVAEKGDEFERQDPLFFVPIVVDRSFNSDMVEIITRPLHANLAHRLVRIIIMTESTSSYNIPDVTAVLDSGIHEVEYFDVESGFTYIQEELIPISYRAERQGLVGRSQAGIAVLFDVEGTTRPDREVPAVRRIDLSKPCLALRRYGCQLENMQGLPNQQKYELFEDSLKVLQRVNILNETRQITEFGKKAVKFSFLHPLFAASVVNFMEGRNSLNASVFACAVFYILENGFEMVADPVNPIFNECFEPRSDLVTVMMAIIKILGDEKETVSEWCSVMTKSGFRPKYLFELKDTLSAISGKSNQEVVKILRDWIHDKNNAFTVIDEVIKCARRMDNTWFENRRARFVQIMNASNDPFIVFRCSRKLIGSEDNILRMQRRPGWQGLTTPGSCFILSIKCNKTRHVSYGFLIHECSDKPERGVVSIEVAPSLNSVFFVSLFEAFIGAENRNKDYVGIQMSSKEDPRTSFVVNITKSGERTLLNYCPKNDAVHQRTVDALATIKPLLPFVPRSILVHYPNLECAVEITSIFTRQNETRLYFYEDLDRASPRAYTINAQILKRLASNTGLLSSCCPKYRFAITGESFIYHRVNGRQVEVDLGYPDTRPELNTVFGEWASHLVLLVDKDESASMGQPNIPWTGPSKRKDPKKEDPMELINVAARIMEANGAVQKSADLFVITLNDCALRVEKGELTPELMSACNATDKRTMRCNFAQLRKALGKTCLRRRNIPPIPIEELTSVSTNGDAGPHIPNLPQFTTKLQNDLSTTFGVGRDSISIINFSNEMLLCRIENLPLATTLHDKPTELLDETYKPCLADVQIANAIESKYKPCVIHSTCIGFTIHHTVHQRLSEDAFRHSVFSLKEKYGCLVTSFEDYVADDGGGDRLGSMFLEVCDEIIAIALAQDIRSSIIADPSFDPENQLLLTRARLTRTMANRGRMLETRVRERYGDRVIEELKEKVAMRRQQPSGAGGIMPGARDIETMEELMLQLLRAGRREIVCMQMDMNCWNEEPSVLPDPLYVYQHDGTVDDRPFCRYCVLTNLQDLTAPFFNQETHLLDFERIQAEPGVIEPIPSVDSEEVGTEFWPMVPLGSLVYTLLREPHVIGPYVRAWVTICAGLAVRSSVNAITACPNHPMLPRRIPNDGSVVVDCPHCNWLMCRVCNKWYCMDEPHMCVGFCGKQCPRCTLPTTKVSGCNHITCDRCGCHWCYVCGGEFGEQIYNHLNQVHGSAW